MFRLLYLINVQAKCFIRFIFSILKKKAYMKSEHLKIYYEINQLQRSCKELWVYFAVRTNTACFEELLKNL